MPAPSFEELHRAITAAYRSPAAVSTLAARVPQGLRRWEQAVVVAHMVAPGLVVVLGCGAGRELVALSELGWKTVGLDVSLPAVAAGRKLSSSGRPQSASVCLIDGMRLPLASQVADSVTLWSQLLGLVAGHAYRVVLLREAFRVLRAGRLVSLSVHDRDLTLNEVEPDQILSLDDPERGDLLIRGPQEGEPAYYHYFDRAELSGLFEEAGFEAPAIRTTSELGESWGNVLVAVARRPSA